MCCVTFCLKGLWIYCSREFAIFRKNISGNYLIKMFHILLWLYLITWICIWKCVYTCEKMWRFVSGDYYWNKKATGQSGSTLLQLLESIFLSCWSKCSIYKTLVRPCMCNSIFHVHTYNSFDWRALKWLFYCYAAKPKCLPGMNFLKLLEGKHLYSIQTYFFKLVYDNRWIINNHIQQQQKLQKTRMHSMYYIV